MIRNLEAWMKACSDSTDALEYVRGGFGAGYELKGFTETPSGRVPVFVDDSFRLSWCLIPAASFDMGMSNDEEAAALELSPEPFLTFERMGPPQRREIEICLMSQSPLTADLLRQEGFPVMDEIGPSSIGLVDKSTADAVVAHFRGALPREATWEYACRAETRSLFWWGNDVPSGDDLERILGLNEPSLPNRFGLVSLFHGEWCQDVWRETLDSDEDPAKGFVVRGGGASRFWPWQDDREWAGCVSAYRMSTADTGGAGCAVRIVRVSSRGAAGEDV